MNTRLPALYHLLDPRPGRTRQASSAGRDPDRGSTWWGLRPRPALAKRILLEPGERHVMAAPRGPGLITRLWLTTFLPANPRALRDVVLRMYWDGEAHPSVLCPLGDFFGAAFGRVTPYSSAVLSLAGGGFTSFWPMPYREGARLELSNEGDAVVDPIYYQVTYTELDAPAGSDLRFHAQWRQSWPAASTAPYTILAAEGHGHYAGCWLAGQNRTWWLRPPFGRMNFPYGFGMGLLEGQEHTVVDGEPAAAGTGTEDFFNGGWYFAGGPFSTPTYGCIVRDYARGRFAAYRFDLQAPLPFRRELRVTIDHGFENGQAGDYTSVAYWYQAEPHLALPPLPPPEARRDPAPIANLAQAGLLLAGPALALAWLARRLLARPRRS